MLTTMSTIMLSAARRVGIQGLCTAKKVRVSSRLRPANGRLKANQKSATETRCVECGVKLPRWKTSRVIGVASTIISAAEGIRSRLIWRMPLPRVRRISAGARRAASRLRVGNSTVATATLKIPCGSM